MDTFHQAAESPQQSPAGTGADTSGASLAAELNSLVGIFNVTTNAEPWPMRYFTPNITNPQQSSLFPESQPNYAPDNVFHTWRSVGLPSDPGTNGVDSGYGDNWPGYLDDTSSYNQADYSPETQEAGDLLRDLEVASQSTHTEQTERHGQNALFCETCSTMVKTRSELNKHMQRHLKLHRCDYESCDRRNEGFSTVNDLIRHKKTVHKEHDEHGPVYICPYGQCPAKPHKVWPRADNFRSHLSRTHNITVNADDDLSRYAKIIPKQVVKKISRLPRQARKRNAKDRKSARRVTSGSENASTGGSPSDTKLPPVEESEDHVTGVGSGHVLDMPADTYIPAQQVGSGMGFTPVLQSPQTSENDFVHVNMASSFRSGDSQATNSNLDFDDSQQNMLSTSFNAIPSVPYGSLNGMPSMPSIYGMGSSTPTMNLQHEASADSGWNFSTLSRKNMDKSQMIELLKTFPKEMLKEALQNGEEVRDEEQMADMTTESSVAQRGSNPCPECGKTFGRPCELKKHLRRHEKPYMCTVRACDKRFGSKNDWKRHETNQHKDVGAWQCTVPGCHAIYMDLEMLRCHLQATHCFKPDKQLELFTEECSIGQANDRSFWCGFCQTIVTLGHGEDGKHKLNSWNARCDHIDGHLSGKDGLELRSFSEWKFIEDQEGSNGITYHDVEQNGVSEQHKKRKGLEYAGSRPMKRLEEGRQN